MSFLKFIGKKKEDAELELPPIDAGTAPPEMPKLERTPPISDRPKMMDPPRPPSLGSMTDMPPTLERPPKEANLPNMPPPAMPPVQEPMPRMQEPMPPMQEPMPPVQESTPPMQEPPKRLPSIEPIQKPRVKKLMPEDFLAEPIVRAPREHIAPREVRHEVQGPLYVKVNDFRSVMADLDLILNDLKESNNIMIRLNSIKNGLDGHFGKWHSEMEDIQRKLVFIDKTLFEELW